MISIITVLEDDPIQIAVKTVPSQQMLQFKLCENIQDKVLR